jgi:hypothetical protein
MLPGNYSVPQPKRFIIMTTFDKEALAQVLKSFDQSNDALWTDDGSPLMAEVQRRANDKTITRAQVNDAIPGFARKLSAKDFVEEPPDEIDGETHDAGDETGGDLSEPVMAAVINSDDDGEDDIFSPEGRERIKAIAQKRVLDAELALTAAQTSTVEARRAEYRAEQRLTKRKQELIANFPPISAAENIKQHLARQQEVLMEQVTGGGFKPNVAANPIDQRLMDRKRNNGMVGPRGGQITPLTPVQVLPRKASAYS